MLWRRFLRANIAMVLAGFPVLIALTAINAPFGVLLAFSGVCSSAGTWYVLRPDDDGRSPRTRR